jgi:hypothetical protein
MVVQKTRKDCRTKEYLINNAVKLIPENYQCSIEEINNKIVAVCDSKLDGNGDGICTSGESCMKFVVDGNAVEKSERNSRDDFIPNDKSFFLERAVAEALK